jgi:hypothetical protein
VSEVAQVGQRRLTKLIRPHPAWLFAVVFASGCGTPPPAAPTSDFGVPRTEMSVPLSGRVIDFATNGGVSGATIEFGYLDLFGKFVAAAKTVSDGTGSYRATRAPGYSALVQIDGTSSGQIQVNYDYRGDFLVRTGTCVARYGTVADALTLRPVSGATVTLSGTTVKTDANGWYRIDLGCPSNGLVGFNTTFVSVSHPDYPSRSFVAGRGVFGVSRMDLSLQKRDFPCRRDPLIQVCVG